MSVTAKEAFQLAFDANGGHERPVQWIKDDADNQRVFFQIYSKLFPIDLSANVRGVYHRQDLRSPARSPRKGSTDL